MNQLGTGSYALHRGGQGAKPYCMSSDQHDMHGMLVSVATACMRATTHSNPLQQQLAHLCMNHWARLTAAF